ncbi:Mor transcription activator family protein [Salinisphaera orenii]|uniref:Mor transcription activator domain-containing protein n=1 Tax=Salinisphaera orenii YIM 95161 TaxID=1051139 RepID=A0A423PRX3_9GAMM|nr:Mor transcription activator family protein [Salinisphaera halophila]ROO28271.1 hypothetical protein SAHL_10750 [Salinisphaera halophila YIM 95161]
MNTPIDTDYLPTVAREIAAVIGMAATCDLIAARGGTRLYVPAQLTPEHALNREIGAEAAAKLVEIYGGDTLDMPRAHAATRAALHRTIVARYIDGASAAQLARDYGVTERWVYALAARRREALASRQDSLF